MYAKGRHQNDRSSIKRERLPTMVPSHALSNGIVLDVLLKTIKFLQGSRPLPEVSVPYASPFRLSFRSLDPGPAQRRPLAKGWPKHSRCDEGDVTFLGLLHSARQPARTLHEKRDGEKPSREIPQFA
jgi:hypothetical protein